MRTRNYCRICQKEIDSHSTVCDGCYDIKYQKCISCGNTVDTLEERYVTVKGGTIYCKKCFSIHN